MPSIALIGDFSSSVTAHRAIPPALERAARATGTSVTWEWIPTAELAPGSFDRLARHQGVWVVPGGPYANTDGALGAIRWARESGRPFLGTCAGFQHAVLEYAREVWQMPDAAHAELDPHAANPVIGKLGCSLVEVTAPIRLIAGTRLAGWYDVTTAIEGYHCNYGVSPAWAARLEDGPLRTAARDENGEVRAVELDGHLFFVATLFQPERSALAGADHPLIQAFVAATVSARLDCPTHAAVRRGEQR